MPNAFGTNEYGWQIVAAFVVLAILVVVGYTVWPTPSLVCPPRLHRSEDGSLRLEPSGPDFPDMNAFQKWWHASRDYANCPLPVLTGARRAHETLREESSDEQMYAKTPIYKVDDYEFSRVFGYERNGHMDVPRENYNKILNQRAFDWPDKPLSSDERRAKYKGLHEGFTAAGDLKSVVMSEPSAEDLVKEAVSRYGEKRHRRPATVDVEEEDVDCRVSRDFLRQDREVAHMVAKAYESDPNYEPVVTKVGANHWEVNELKPHRRHVAYEEQGNDTVVDTGNDAVDIEFQYRENRVNEEAIDPFFLATGDLPFQSERRSRDPWYGPVPGMERMFGPTFDRKNWY